MDKMSFTLPIHNNVVHVNLHLSYPLADCKVSQTGEHYRGPIFHTVTYHACQRWDQQLPHPHPYTTPGTFPDMTLAEAGNACRNPSRARADGPWCYTLDPAVEWEYCPVHYCNHTECEMC